MLPELSTLLREEEVSIPRALITGVLGREDKFALEDASTVVAVVVSPCLTLSLVPEDPCPCGRFCCCELNTDPLSPTTKGLDSASSGRNWRESLNLDCGRKDDESFDEGESESGSSDARF
jgi:hypothetical protein